MGKKTCYDSLHLGERDPPQICTHAVRNVSGLHRRSEQTRRFSDGFSEHWNDSDRSALGKQIVGRRVYTTHRPGESHRVLRIDFQRVRDKWSISIAATGQAALQPHHLSCCR